MGNLSGYDELVKQCRDCIDCLCGDCKYEHLQKPGNFVPCMNALLGEAANAIEALSAAVEGYESSTNMALVEKDGETVIEFVQKWIPVAERLPENDGWYLVYAPNYRGGSSSGLKRVDGKMFGKFVKGKWSIEHGYYNRPGIVTHWMPLPPAPKEET